MKVEFTEKKVTALGGMKLMKDLLDSTGIRKFMSNLYLPEKRYSRGCELIQILYSSKPGRPSNHPLMVFIAETRKVANYWPHPGNTSALINCKTFIDEPIAKYKYSFFTAQFGIIVPSF